jgi:site-specific DNA recombinase
MKWELSEARIVLDRLKYRQAFCTIALAEKIVSAAYLYTLLRLPWLAPDITTAIINGRQPPQLTAQALMRLTPRLPANWAKQRKLLGFH